MECDELIEQMLKEPDQHAEEHTDKHRERLAALVAGGKCSQYLGENYTIEKIDNMTDEEIRNKQKDCTSKLNISGYYDIMWLEILILSQQFIIMGCIGYAILYYVRLKYLDELIEQMLKKQIR